MSATATQEGTEGKTEETQDEGSVGRRSRPSFDSESAREAGRRSAESRRARKLEREQAADFDRLTVRARSAVVAAKVLTAAEQEALLRAHLKEAQAGKVQSARFVMDWLKLAQDDGQDEAQEGKTWEQMTQAQRAAVRAKLEADLRAIEGSDVPIAHDVVSQSQDDAA